MCPLSKRYHRKRWSSLFQDFLILFTHLILCLARISLHYLYALTDVQRPEKDTKKIQHCFTLEMLFLSPVQLAVKGYWEVLVWDLNRHIRPIAGLPEVHPTIHASHLNRRETPRL